MARTKKDLREKSKKDSPCKKRKLPFSLRIRCRDRMENLATASTEGSKDAKSVKTNWRNKLKNQDPKKYKTIKETEQTYSRLYRLNMSLAEATLKKRNLTEQEKTEAGKWMERKKTYNEGCRKRQRKYVKNKKEKQKNQPKKPLTRRESDKNKDYEKNKKRKQRANYSAQRKEAVLERRREIYANKQEDKFNQRLRKMKEEEDRLKAIEERLKEKELELQNQTEELAARNKEIEALDLRSESAKRKSLSRAKSALPRQPIHFAATVSDIIDKSSPRKSGALKKVGVSRRNGNGKKTLEEAVTAELAGEIQMEQNKPKRKLLASALSAMKKYKLQREACRRFKINRKLLKSKKKRQGKMALRLDVIQEVRRFYEANSTQLPDKKFVSKKTGKPRHIIETSISALHEKYQIANPDKKVSSAVFFRLRPRHVRPKQQAKYNGCLCEYCENVNLKLNILQRHLPQNTNMYQLVNLTLCNKPEEMQYHKPACIKRQCNDCGINALDTLVNNEDRDTPVEWKRWEIAEVEFHSAKGKSAVKKRTLQEKKGNLQELLHEMKKEIEPHAEHLFNKDWQHSQFKQLKDKLGRNDVVSVWDFSENYKCNYQREVQSAYYSQDSATLHPVITYYKCTTCDETVQESCVFISNDLHHDHHLVNTFQQKLADHLTETRQLPLHTLHRYSDGCASQYKSKGPFSDVSYATEDFDFNINHHFYGTRHGKGASDGEGAVIKSQATRAVMAGTTVIRNSLGLSNFTREHLTKSPPEGKCCQPFMRTVFHVHAEEVDRERDRKTRPVKGTRKIHSVKNVKAGVISTRNLSCFCDFCLKGEEQQCINAAYVMNWNKVNLHGSKTVKKTKPTKSKPAKTKQTNTKPAKTKPTNTKPPKTKPDKTRTNQASSSMSKPPTPKRNNACSDKSLNCQQIVSRDQSANSNPFTSATSATNRDKVLCAKDLANNMYVAVRFRCRPKNVIYFAMIIKVEDGGVTLAFMKRMNAEEIYSFTKEKHHVHPIEDIAYVLTAPEPTISSRSLVYKFLKSEIVALGEKEQAVLK